FLLTGLSGKMRIQMRPPRLMWRVIARRAASICRAVRRPRPVAFKPYSPKLTLFPRVATPVLRPFCSLRNLRLAGCSTSGSCSCGRLAGFARRRLLGLGGRCADCAEQRLLVLGHDLTLEHPDLDADDAVRRLRFGESVIDVGAHGMERHASFPIPLGAGDFYAVQSARAHDLDALSAETHGIGNRALHR